MCNNPIQTLLPCVSAFVNVSQFARSWRVRTKPASSAAATGRAGAHWTVRGRPRWRRRRTRSVRSGAGVGVGEGLWVTVRGGEHRRASGLVVGVGGRRRVREHRRRPRGARTMRLPLTSPPRTRSSSPPTPGCAGVHPGLERGWGGRRAGAALSAMRLQPLTVVWLSLRPGGWGPSYAGRQPVADRGWRRGWGERPQGSARSIDGAWTRPTPRDFRTPVAHGRMRSWGTVGAESAVGQGCGTGERHAAQGQLGCRPRRRVRGGGGGVVGLRSSAVRPGPVPCGLSRERRED